MNLGCCQKTNNNLLKALPSGLLAVWLLLYHLGHSIILCNTHVCFIIKSRKIPKIQNNSLSKASVTSCCFECFMVVKGLNLVLKNVLSTHTSQSKNKK